MTCAWLSRSGFGGAGALLAAELYRGPLDEDLRPFSALLWGHNIGHRIAEEGGAQVLHLASAPLTWVSLLTYEPFIGAVFALAYRCCPGFRCRR